MPIDARRDQILDAAQRLIIADGYAAASMEAIAREANLVKPRVYAGYSGRGQLLRTLLERRGSPDHRDARRRDTDAQRRHRL
jgi:AcrR family transcriptional regulator